MKTKRRHELHTNALADWLGKKLEWIRPFAAWIMLGMAAVVAAIVILTLSRGHSAAQMAEASNRFEQDSTEAFAALRDGKDLAFRQAADRMERLASDYRGTPLAAFVNARLGDIFFLRGQRLMGKDCPAALEDLKTAADKYGAAIEATDDPLVKERLLFSQGKTYEWTFKLDDARQKYKAVVEMKKLLAPSAQERLKNLDLPATADFYNRLRKGLCEPKQPAPAGDTDKDRFGKPPDDFLPPFGAQGLGSPPAAADSSKLPDLGVPPFGDLPGGKESATPTQKNEKQKGAAPGSTAPPEKHSSAEKAGSAAKPDSGASPSKASSGEKADKASPATADQKSTAPAAGK